MSPKKNDPNRNDDLKLEPKTLEGKPNVSAKPAKKLLRCGNRFYYADVEEESPH